MNEIRRAFLHAAAVATELVASPATGASWLRPSVLSGWSVAVLAAHLGRATSTVTTYLDSEPAPDAVDVDAAGYYLGAIALIASDPRLAEGITARAEEAASGGQFGVVEHLERTVDVLTERLDTAPSSRRVQVFGGVAMLLDDYLRTRLVELAVHVDDLAVSIGIDTPMLDDTVHAEVSHTLVDVARRMHGESAVLRALARPDRAPAGGICVFR